MKLICRYAPQSSDDLPFCILGVAEEEGEEEALHIYVCSRVDEARALVPLLADRGQRREFEASLVHAVFSPHASIGTTEYRSSAARTVYTMLAEGLSRPRSISEPVNLPKPRLYITPADEWDPPMVTLFFPASDGSCVVHLVYSLRQYYEACDDPELEWEMYAHADEFVELLNFPDESPHQAHRVTGDFAAFLVRGLQACIDRKRVASVSEDVGVNVPVTRNTLLS